MADTLESTAVLKDSLFVPLIDFGGFLDGDTTSRAETAASVLAGFQQSGFIYLKNHAIPPEIVARTFELSADFFKRPLAEKDALAWDSPTSNRGYSCMGREKTSEHTDRDAVSTERDSFPDIKESYEIGREDEPGQPNHWPTGPGSAQFADGMRAFFHRCQELHVQVMRAVALALGLDERWFDGYLSHADNTLRLLHYPTVKHGVLTRGLNGQVRAGAHSDYGTITLLFQDARGGLQIRSPQGTFVDATPIPDTVVVNAADLLARWSNDTIKSTIHRVVEPPPFPTSDKQLDEHPARYSIAYFANPNFDAFIDVIPGTASEADKKYAGVNSGEYLVQRLTATY